MLQKVSLNHFYNSEYMNDNESCASTNKDSNMTSSIKTNNFYNFYRNKNSYKDNYEKDELKSKISNIGIQSYMSHIIYKGNKNENNKNSSITKRNYYTKDYTSFNNLYRHSNRKNSIINKTLFTLNLKKGNFKQNISKFETKNNIMLRKSNKGKDKAKKLYDKMNKTQPIKKEKKSDYNINLCNKKEIKINSNDIYIGDKFDINHEKKKLGLIKKQYIKNIKRNHITFHDIKTKMRNIKEYQNNILALNNKCLKYSSLSKEDILKKYKEENKKNLKEYKLKKEKMNKRPLSYNKGINKNKNTKILRKKVFSAELVSKKVKRENDIKDKIINIKNFNNHNIKCYNSLRLFNDILDKNKDKKIRFYNYLKHKVNDNKTKKRYFSQNISAKIKFD